MTISRLVIIDTRVGDYQKIIDGLKSDTVAHVLLDYSIDTYESLTNKITQLSLTSPLESVALVSHGVRTPIYKLLESSSPAQLADVSSNDPNLDSWSEFKNFFIGLCVPVIDLLGCALYMDDNWKYVLNTLESQMSVNFRASVDNTGSLALGGNWILESDNVNIKDIYFNENIDEWIGLLQAYANTKSYFIDVYGTLTYILNNQLYTIKHPSNRPFIQVSTGFSHAACIDISNNLYTFGSNVYGQLGYNSFESMWDISSNPVNVNNNKKIINVACGIEHTLCLDASGRVYTCGFNGNGQLGHNDLSNRNTFTLVSSISNEEVTQIYANILGSVCVTKSGRLFVWGDTAAYGTTNDNSNNRTPIRVTVDSSGNSLTSEFITEACLSNFFGFITSTGKIYTSNSLTTRPSLKNITNEPNSAVSIMGNFNNTFVLTRTNNMYYIGRDISNTSTTLTTFSLLKNSFRSPYTNLNIKRAADFVYGNDLYCFFLDFSGNVYGLGTNNSDFGTLGIGAIGQTTTNLTPITLLNKPIMALMDDNSFDYSYLSNFTIDSSTGIIAWDYSLLPGTYQVIIDASSSSFVSDISFTLTSAANRYSPTNFTYDLSRVDISYGAPINFTISSLFDNGNNTDLSFVITPSHSSLTIISGTRTGDIALNVFGQQTNLLDASTNRYTFNIRASSLSRQDLSANTSISIKVDKMNPSVDNSGVTVTDLSFGFNLGSSIINGTYVNTNRFVTVNPDTYLIVPGTISWDTPSATPDASFNANQFFQRATAIGGGNTITTRAKFYPTNTTNYNTVDISSSGLRVFIKPIKPTGITYNNNLTKNINVGNTGTQALAFDNPYSYGGLPLTYKIREIRKIA
jgi:alpha-tubulin suppressor-like RCC1 family protein